MRSFGAAAKLTAPPLDKAGHVRYFLACLKSLPAPYASLDTNRMTIAYFCLSGLDLLGALDKVDAPVLVRWIYSQQVRRPEGSTDEGWLGGFRAPAIYGGPFDPAGCAPSSPFDSGHIAMTYVALASLLILGDDLGGVERAATLRHVRSLQQADGSFRAVLGGGENDMRFVYCAAAVCAMLKDGGGAGEDLGEEGSAYEWEGMDVASASSYILASQAYDGALGMGPGEEAHGGSTCAHSPVARVLIHDAQVRLLGCGSFADGFVGRSRVAGTRAWRRWR